MPHRNPDYQRRAEQMFAAAIALAQLGEDFDELLGLRGVEGEALLLVLDPSRAAEPDTSSEAGSVPITPGRLGRALRLPSASVTAVIDRLERAGHIERVRDTSDRRRVLLVPTAAARRARDAFWGGLNDQVLAEFGGSELAAVERFLQRVIRLAADHRAEPGRARGS